MKGLVLDLRPTCKRCGKHPRGKMRLREWDRYQPFCSYQCQEFFKIEDALRYLEMRKQVMGGEG